MPRCVAAEDFQIFQIQQPFSTFDFVEQHFQGSHPIRRLFSIARSQGARSLTLERIPATGILADENAEIAERVSDHSSSGCYRVSFWKQRIEVIEKATDEACIGYAILKHDRSEACKINDWHVFEAVMRKYPHHHNYVHAKASFSFSIHEVQFSIEGCLYAQQNALNKACAQVALKSLISTYKGEPDIYYRKINELAANDAKAFNPANGLTAKQIAAVLTGFNIPFVDYDYASNNNLMDLVPYRQVVYRGIENGTGALMGFSLKGNEPDPGRHIIPCYGHTFNEDSWAPHADVDYFHVGEEIRYTPSHAWMSSLIVHDDNFGANLCIPAAFIPKEQVQYAVELLPPDFTFSGQDAELIGSNYFYSIVYSLNDMNNLWLKRLFEYMHKGRLILRTVPITFTKYVQSLSTIKDWQGNVENNEIIDYLKTWPNGPCWLVEVSIPEVFSTNKRRIGEILIDGASNPNEKMDGKSFVLARMPGHYIFFNEMDSEGPNFLNIRSSILSHVPLYSAF